MRRALLLFAVSVALAACGGSVNSGRGWELLSFDRSGPVYSVLLAQDQDDIDRLWERFGLPLAKPTVDFNRQVVIGLGHAVSGSCPEITFKGLVIEPDHVYGKYRLGGVSQFRACTTDANPATFWLAVDRTALPERFILSLTADGICTGCPEESIEVDFSDPDPPTPWWEASRLGLVLNGAPSDGFRLIETVPATELGNPVLALSPGGDPWLRSGQVAVVFSSEHPTRIEVFSATCPDGLECGQGQGLIKEAQECGVDTALRERDDFTAVITFNDDGTCTGELIEGLDWPY